MEYWSALHQQEEIKLKKRSNTLPMISLIWIWTKRWRTNFMIFKNNILKSGI